MVQEDDKGTAEREAKMAATPASLFMKAGPPARLTPLAAAMPPPREGVGSASSAGPGEAAGPAPTLASFASSLQAAPEAAQPAQQNKGGGKALTRLALQLESRVRFLEAIVLTQVTAQGSWPPVQEADRTLKWYLSQVKGAPQHTLGSPHPHVFGAFLRCLGTLSMDPESMPTELLQRILCMRMLSIALDNIPLNDISGFVRHFQVQRNYGSADTWRVIWHIDGYMNLPAPTRCIDFFQVLKSGSSSDRNNLVAEHVVMVDFCPKGATDHRVTAVSKILLSLMCQCGATRITGRAPPGAAARTLKGKGKGNNGDDEAMGVGLDD